MTANPVTDQVLANLRHVRGQLTSTPQPLLESFDDFATRIAASLPEMEPTTIGQVLLHAGDLYSRFAANGAADAVLPVETLLPVRMLTEAGQRLFEPDGGL